MKLGSIAHQQAVYTERKGEAEIAGPKAEITDSKADIIFEKKANMEKRLNTRRWRGKNKQNNPQQNQNQNPAQNQNTEQKVVENSSVGTQNNQRDLNS